MTFFAAMGFHAFDIRKQANIFLIFETYEPKEISNGNIYKYGFFKDNNMPLEKQKDVNINL